MTIYQQQQGEGPDIVLLHGWGFSSNIWQPFIEQLKQPYRLTLIDLPGFGQSAALTQHNLTSVCQALLPYLPSQAVYLGWSLGGLIATAIARDYPQRVNGLMTLTCNPKFIATDSWPGVTEAILEKFRQQLQQNFHGTLSRFITLQCHHPQAEKSLIKTLKQKIIAHGAPQQAILSAYLTLLIETDLRQTLTQLSCPQLHLFGRLDTLVPATITQSMQALLPKGSIISLAQAGHMPFASHPTEVISCLEQLMESSHARV